MNSFVVIPVLTKIVTKKLIEENFVIRSEKCDKKDDKSFTFQT